MTSFWLAASYSSVVRRSAVLDVWVLAVTGSMTPSKRSSDALYWTLDDAGEGTQEGSHDSADLHHRVLVGEVDRGVDAEVGRAQRGDGDQDEVLDHVVHLVGENHLGLLSHDGLESRIGLVARRVLGSDVLGDPSEFVQTIVSRDLDDVAKVVVDSVSVRVEVCVD